MDFFGFGSSTDLSTPVGILVRSATDSFLVSPDWSKNLDICDAVSNTGEGAEHAARAIMRRLGDSDPKVVSLALVVAETCMKNCGKRFAGAITQTFMDELIAVGRGRSSAHNTEEALRILQQWGRAFEQKKSTYPIFFETYMSLKAKNVRFPPEEEGITPGFEPKKTSAPAPAPAPASVSSRRDDRMTSSPQSRDSAKLERDLITVFEKVRLCQEMLQESPGIAHDEALSEVVGFLEACRDRIIDIIEAGSLGLLSEELFAMVLKVNDSILRTLEAEKTGQKIDIEEIGISDAPSSSSAAVNQTDDLLDVFGGGSGPVSSSAAASASPAIKASKPAATAMAIDDEDEFGMLTMKKTGGAAVPKPLAPIKKLAPPPSGPSRSAPAASNQTSGTGSDLFGDELLIPMAAPAPTPAPAPAPSWNDLLAPVPIPTATSNNPFDAPVPTHTTSHPPAPPSSTATANDIDLLFASIPTPAPASLAASSAPLPTTTGTVTSEQMTDADFDAFLSGLKS